MSVKFSHVIAQEAFGRFYRHLAVVGDHPRGELDIGFHRVHLGRIQETQNAT